MQALVFSIRKAGNPATAVEVLKITISDVKSLASKGKNELLSHFSGFYGHVPVK